MLEREPLPKIKTDTLMKNQTPGVVEKERRPKTKANNLITTSQPAKQSICSPKEPEEAESSLISPDCFNFILPSPAPMRKVDPTPVFTIRFASSAKSSTRTHRKLLKQILKQPPRPPSPINVASSGPRESRRVTPTPQGYKAKSVKSKDTRRTLVKTDTQNAQTKRDYHLR